MEEGTNHLLEESEGVELEELRSSCEELKALLQRERHDHAVEVGQLLARLRDQELRGLRQEIREQEPQSPPIRGRSRSRTRAKREIEIAMRWVAISEKLIEVRGQEPPGGQRGGEEIGDQRAKREIEVAISEKLIEVGGQEPRAQQGGEETGDQREKREIEVAMSWVAISEKLIEVRGQEPHGQQEGEEIGDQFPVSYPSSRGRFIGFFKNTFPQIQTHIYSISFNAQLSRQETPNSVQRITIMRR